jgi:HAAS
MNWLRATRSAGQQRERIGISSSAAPGNGTPPLGDQPAVERYLTEVSARLPGSPRANSGIVAELRSGLADATDAHCAAGLTAPEAAAAAIDEFGDPADVADGFRAEIAAGLARRCAVAVLVTGPLVGVLWLVTAVASHLTPHLQWADLPPGLQVGVPLVGIAAGVTACGALFGIAATGRLTRWLPALPRQAPAAAAIAGFGAIGADALGLALLGVQLATAAGKLSPWPAAAAAAASIARLLFARRAARRCLSVRAGLA